jgi:hypothetical protein
LLPKDLLNLFFMFFGASPLTGLVSTSASTKLLLNAFLLIGPQTPERLSYEMLDSLSLSASEYLFSSAAKVDLTFLTSRPKRRFSFAMLVGVVQFLAGAYLASWLASLVFGRYLTKTYY